MVEVIATDEWLAWFQGLSDPVAERVAYGVGLLEQHGVGLPYPHSSSINNSRHGAMRELRIQAHGHPIRIFYAFDRARDAVLLIGGDKTGLSDRRFYSEYVPIADAIYDAYLLEQAAPAKGKK
jgi:hypothetical protein